MQIHCLTIFHLLHEIFDLIQDFHFYGKVLCFKPNVVEAEISPEIEENVWSKLRTFLGSANLIMSYRKKERSR